MALTGKSSRPGRVLIIVENLPVPFDRRVWSEATTLRTAGYQVAVICPKGQDATASYEFLDGIHVYRHRLFEAKGRFGYVLEYASAFFFQFTLTFWIWLRLGFDVIHACNPPDTIFIVAWPFKCLGKKFLFDHHDINPELYLAKFGKKDLLYRAICALERQTFRAADVSIATNESYREIALTRGGMPADRVFVVRSGPKLERMRVVAANEERKHGARYLVGYVGVIGQQEGIDLLLEAVKYIIEICGRTDVRFAIVGGGPAQAKMQALSVQLGVASYVDFYGRVSDDVLLEVLNTADVCVNPDSVNDMNDKSTMNKIMEYMALSKPIVQFELREGRFSAQEASLYAAPNDPIDFARKILELLDDPVRRAEMGAFGRLRVETELAWEMEAPKLLAAYETILHDSGVVPELSLFSSDLENLLAVCTAQPAGARLIVTPNLDHFRLLERSSAFRKAYAGANLLVNDSRVLDGLIVRGRALCAPGSEWVPILLRRQKSGTAVAIVGASLAVRDLLQKQLPDLNFHFFEPSMGYIRKRRERRRLAGEIAAAAPKLVLVCTGAPQSEIFAYQLARSDLMRSASIVCCGAALQFLSGEKLRAPVPLRRLGLEWLWRFVREPHTRPRYMADAVFLIRNLRRFLLLRSQGRARFSHVVITFNGLS